MRMWDARLALCLAVVGCQPGLAVDVYNAGAEEVLLVAVGAGGARREERLPPGGSGTLGGALAWHVVAGDESWAIELPHPGEGHASRTLRGRYSAAYRFQIEERCVYALGPDQRPPVREFAPQPPGYPVGPEGPCLASGRAAGLVD